MLKDALLGHEHYPQTEKRYKRRKPDDLILELSSDVADLLADKERVGLDPEHIDAGYIREMLFRTYHALCFIREKMDGATE